MSRVCLEEGGLWQDVPSCSVWLQLCARKHNWNQELPGVRNQRGGKRCPRKGQLWSGHPGVGMRPAGWGFPDRPPRPQGPTCCKVPMEHNLSLSSFFPIGCQFTSKWDVTCLRIWLTPPPEQRVSSPARATLYTRLTFHLNPKLLYGRGFLTSFPFISLSFASTYPLVQQVSLSLIAHLILICWQKVLSVPKRSVCPLIMRP